MSDQNRDGILYGKLNVGLSKLVRLLSKFRLCKKSVFEGEPRGKYLNKFHKSIRMIRDPEFAARVRAEEKAIKDYCGAQYTAALILLMAKTKASKKINATQHNRNAIANFVSRVSNE